MTAGIIDSQPLVFLDAVTEIARLGADAVMSYWRALTSDQVTEKARNDLVSAADTASEEAILGAIQGRFPDHRILSEESGWSGNEGEVPTWVVDPLDGTTNFVQGFPHFAVSVGVVVAGRGMFGVVIDPVKNDLFRAARGHGVWFNGEKCATSTRPGLSGAMLATGFPFRAHQLLDPYLAIFKDVFLRGKAIRRPGAAALDLAYTACGIFDGFFEFCLQPWDIAAGAVMVKEAGGTVTDADGNDQYLTTGHVICGTPGVHRDLLEVIQHHRPAWSAGLLESTRKQS